MIWLTDAVLIRCWDTTFNWPSTDGFSPPSLSLAGDANMLGGRQLQKPDIPTPLLIPV